MSNKNKKKDGIVYSTNPNFEYNHDEELEPDTVAPNLQTLYVRREVRNGKATIVVKEFVGKNEDLRDLEKKLKNHCGVGGSSKEGEILIQGENKDKVVAFLQKLGYKTKG